MRHDETIEKGREVASGQGADLAAFYDRRAAAALAYCSRLCAPEAIADAVEASFARVFEARPEVDASDGEALDRSLRSAVRTESASRASAATSGMPARRLLERLADPNRGGACELMPALLAARADGLLTDGDRERMSGHLRRCAECRMAEHRFNEAEAAFDALASDDAPALGRSLLAEMIADAPLSERRRFARERLASDPPEWLEEIDWEEQRKEPRVVRVPDDALEPVVPARDGEQPPEAEVVEHEEPPEAEVVEQEEPESPAEVEPAVTSVATQDFPMLGHEQRRRRRLSARARKRIAITMLVLGALLLGEAALTVLWKEPFTAFIAARAQDGLTKELHKLDTQQLSATDQKRVASIRDAGRRTDARIAALAARERAVVGQGDAIGTLRIKKLGVEYVVVQGTDPASLRTGPAHYLETPFPGQHGTMGIAGHRTTYEAPFRHIDDLKRGDTIAMKMPYGLFTYSVDRQRIVPADYKGAFAGAGTGEG
ncbi:MAG: sortase, partial [Solirubrobacteraceae bacterium]|nr:sortase [Solirubrobacteraceae bacterium]